MPTLTSSKRIEKLKKSNAKDSPIDMNQVACIILSGGEGTRLYPLTLTRCKPAVNIGGKYRLIDVPISHAIHANCYKIYVLSQFLSSSLHHHIFQTYMQNGRAASLIEILTAEQKPSHKSWFQGTADAVRQNIDYLLESPVEYFLILSGDQLYDIRFDEMVRFAKLTNADLVVAALPVTEKEAARMGVLKINEDYDIIDFFEKPQDSSLYERLRSSEKMIERLGTTPSSQRHFLGSMGIYLFKRQALVHLLANDSREDFGKHLIPTQLATGKVSAYLYNGYWEDIGTIETFYRSNIALTESKPLFTFYNEKRPIFSPRYELPPAKFSKTHVENTLLCEGTISEADHLIHSILGLRSVVGEGTQISHSYIMGNDYYETSINDHQKLPSKPSIGKNCIISKAIVDKNVAIGNNVHLINRQNLTHYTSDNLYIRDGIIIVPRGATIPDGYKI